MIAYWDHIDDLKNVSAHDFFAWACKRRGWVYLAQNERGWLKLGRTAKTPHARMKSLYSAGAAQPLILLDAVLFVDSFWAETRAHRNFLKWHIEREYYDVPMEDVKAFLIDCKNLEVLLCSDLSRAFLLHAPPSATYAIRQPFLAK